jgi:hypothetical protein
MRRLLLAILGFAVMAIGLTAPLSLSPDRLAANEGDPLHISWILAWNAHQLTREPLELFESNTFYPYEGSLSFSEHMVIEGILAAPLNLLTGNALLAQNVTVLFMYAFAGAAMFLFVREVLGRDDAAWIAGILFAFNSHQLSQLPRLQLLTLGFWPLAAFFLYRFLRDGSRWSAVLFAACLLSTNLSSTYYLVYVSLVLVWWMPASYLLFRRWPSKRDVVWLGVPVAVAAAITLLFALPYLDRFSRFGFERDLAMGLDLTEYWLPESKHTLWGWLPFAGRGEEVSYFLGYVTFLLAACGVLFLVFGRDETRRRGMLWLSLATAVIGGVLSLGPVMLAAGRGFGRGPYWWLYDVLPLVRGLRSPERIAVLVFFGISILAGYGASKLLTRCSGPVRAVALVGLTLLLPLEHYMGPPRAVAIPTGEDAPAVYRYLAELESEGDGDGSGAVVELPLYPRVQLRFYSLYMFYSTLHWKPIVFGRTSFYPPVSEFLAWELRHSFPSEESIDLLAAIGVETLVVHPLVWPETDRGQYIERLDALVTAGRIELLETFPEGDGPVAHRLGFGGERVYRLLAAPRSERASLCQPTEEIPPDTWSAQASGEDDPSKAIDGNPGTKWRKRAPEREDYFEIDLGKDETVSAVRIPLSYPFDEFPRNLILRGRDETGPARRIRFREDLDTKIELVRDLIDEPSQASLTLRFPPTRTRWLRLILRLPEPDLTLPDWAMSEVQVFRACTR